MGIKHLNEVEELLKKKKEALTKGQIREKISINNATLIECLNYLNKNGLVFTELNKRGFETYKWIG